MELVIVRDRDDSLYCFREFVREHGLRRIIKYHKLRIEITKLYTLVLEDHTCEILCYSFHKT